MDLSPILYTRPAAKARLLGSAQYPKLRGTLWFYHAPGGVLVKAAFHGLPSSEDPCISPVFGLHIHQGESYTGEPAFANTSGHYNPHNCPHPYHAGDLLPVLGAKGHSFSAFLTDRFSVCEIIGRTVVLHAMPDDFHTQPAGNSGEKIACGVIEKI